MSRLRVTFLLSTALCLAPVEAAEPVRTDAVRTDAMRVDTSGADTLRMQERLDRLEAQLQNQGLLGLLTRLTESKVEIARLRGALEEFAHQLKLAEQRQKDYYQDLDQRLKALDGRLVALAAQAPKSAEGVSLQPAGMIKGLAKPTVQTVIQPAGSGPAGSGPVASGLVISEKPPVQPPTGLDGIALYEKGSAIFKRGKYPEAVAAFEQYVKDYPDSDLTANALYWLGLSYLAMEDFKQAAEAQQRLIKRFPKHDKRADAMLSLARVQARLKQNAAARETLDQLVEQYPKSKAAGTGRKLRAILD